MKSPATLISVALVTAVALAGCANSSPPGSVTQRGPDQTASAHVSEYVREIYHPDRITFEDRSGVTRVLAFGLDNNAPVSVVGQEELFADFAGDELRIGWLAMGCVEGLHSGLTLRVQPVRQGELVVDILEQPPKRGRPCEADIEVAGIILRISDNNVTVTAARVRQILNGDVKRAAVAVRNRQ